MTTHQLDLLENAIDSLREALAKFEEGDAGETKAFKFAVLHMAHFMELMFKYHVSQKHPLLIYTNPFAPNLDRNKTITLNDAINFIKNEAEEEIPVQLKADLDWIKRLRNQIEHHKFEMQVPEVRTTMGRLFRAITEFFIDHSDVDLEGAMPADVRETFKVLSSEYEFRRRDALHEAEEIEDANPVHYKDPDATPARFECGECGTFTLALNEDSSTGYRCTFCGNEEGDELPSQCDICGATCDTGDLSTWENEDGRPESRCYYCSGRYHAEKDRDD